jgi:single-stranded-DNA-specific exonuclease
LLRHFEPFGPGNPSPSLLARGVHLSSPPRVLSHDGLKMRLGRVAGPLDAVAWGAAHRLPELDAGGPVDVVFRVERDEWQGEQRVQAKVTDFRV